MSLETESVGDYPRPPRLEAVRVGVRVEHLRVVVAESSRALRVLETSHPPVYYLPPGDCQMDLLRPSARRGSFCEWKGAASYWDLVMAGAGGAEVRVAEVAWSYARPTASFAGLKDHLAFYASKVDACFVGGERVAAQPGDFYGGWITSWVRGPFKGGPGTMGW